MAHNTITIRVRTFLFVEKTIQARGLKLGRYVHLMSFYTFVSGIFEKQFFSIFMAENGP